MKMTYTRQKYLRRVARVAHFFRHTSMSIPAIAETVDVTKRMVYILIDQLAGIQPWPAWCQPDPVELAERDWPLWIGVWVRNKNPWAMRIESPDAIDHEHLLIRSARHIFEPFKAPHYQEALLRTSFLLEDYLEQKQLIEDWTRIRSANSLYREQKSMK